MDKNKAVEEGYFVAPSGAFAVTIGETVHSLRAGEPEHSLLEYSYDMAAACLGAVRHGKAFPEAAGAKWSNPNA